MKSLEMLCLAALAASMFAACASDDSGSGDPADAAGTPRDTGTVQDASGGDGGQIVRPDGATPTPDTGAPNPDADSPTPDAVVPIPDAGGPEPDAALPPADADLPPADAAPPPECPADPVVCFSNLDCPADSRCFGSEDRDACCVTAPRGDRVVGDPCDYEQGQEQCDTGICVMGDVSALCSGPCETADDCPPNMPQCIPIAFSNSDTSWCFPAD